MGLYALTLYPGKHRGHTENTVIAQYRQYTHCSTIRKEIAKMITTKRPTKKASYTEFIPVVLKFTIDQSQWLELKTATQFYLVQYMFQTHRPAASLALPSFFHTQLFVLTLGYNGYGLSLTLVRDMSVQLQPLGGTVTYTGICKYG